MIAFSSWRFLLLLFCSCLAWFLVGQIPQSCSLCFAFKQLCSESEVDAQRATGSTAELHWEASWISVVWDGVCGRDSRGWNGSPSYLNIFFIVSCKLDKCDLHSKISLRIAHWELATCTHPFVLYPHVDSSCARVIEIFLDKREFHTIFCRRIGFRVYKAVWIDIILWLALKCSGSSNLLRPSVVLLFDALELTVTRLLCLLRSICVEC